MKLEIRARNFELIFDGSEEFAVEHILPLIPSRTSSSESPEGASLNTSESNEVALTPDGLVSSSHSIPSLSVESICAILGNGTSAASVLEAAVAWLILVAQNKSPDRKEILEAMKKATGYYNDNMGSNLSATLKAAIKGKWLISSSQSTYTLSAPKRADIEQKLKSEVNQI